jgi:RNA polymerase sigma-70 factor (ECF subfamily)
MDAYARGDGERAIFEELFTRYVGDLTALMRRGYRSEHEAQDLVQQVFLQLHRGRRDYRSGSPFRPWLMTIARNVLRDRIRYVRRRLHPVSLDSILAAHAPTAPDGGQDRAALKQELEHAMARLPRNLRDLIQARFFEHVPHDQIAQRLAITKGAAKVRVTRALAALRKILTEASNGPM